MEGILALCHFCETHGPCVILCTQRFKQEPNQSSQNLSASCDACFSINANQALICRENGKMYVTTRVPLQQDLAFLLKQAAIRSLSCEEETSKDGGSIYFGDSERGHVISHSFLLQDSLARGFQRKYSVLMLMKDKVHLLNIWPSLSEHIKELIKDLQQQAARINELEQEQKSQRALRQAQGSPKTTSRSLSELTGQPAIFGHIHLWFSWVLNSETITEKSPRNVMPLPSRSPVNLRSFCRSWLKNNFQTVCFCVLTGCELLVDDESVRETFRTLLPEEWPPCRLRPPCILKYKKIWKVEWSEQLPNKLPSLQIEIEKALRNPDLPDAALESFFNYLLLRWRNIASNLVKVTSPDDVTLLQSMGVQDCDKPLLKYWIENCK
ncbi:folliculin isoform X1 [Agrilus planipennis]|uniref:Folliculin isoform X1 n=1 Tax=Agrilus planipennis TaxID=224129 RepID=A0A1W4X4G9_AGRPL|nr:folliculin isoform X1 [Agrilus planipennis]